MNLPPEDKRLFLLDAYALIFRAYYAFIKNPRINSQGINTSAIFGFINSLLDLIKRENPTHLAVCFDVGGQTVRHEDFNDYKANRQETPEAIRVAVPYIHQILAALKIPILSMEGFEADDIIGTLAKKGEKEGYTTFMVTSDKDFGQLVSDHIKMYKPASRGNDIEILGVEEIKQKYGIQDPLQVIDLLAMMGDAVDNIPGLPGVGEKTAIKFIQEFGSLENLLANTDKLSGKIKEKIEENKEIGILSKKLATIITDVPIEFDESKLIMEKPDFEEIKKIFNELEFRFLLENLYRTYGWNFDHVMTESPPSTPKQTKNPAVYQTNLFEQPEDISFNTIENKTYQDSETVSHHYQLIDTPMARKILLNNLLKQKEVCFDTETTSLNELEAELVGISFSFEPHKAFYIPVKNDEASIVLNELKDFFENENIAKIGHNLKYDLKILRKYGIQVKGRLNDTMISHYLINPDGRHNMDVLSENYLNYKPISMESLIGKKGKNQGNFKDVDLQTQTEYAAEDADITFQLKNTFDPKLKEKQLEKLFNEVEVPVMKVLADMEWEGISLDKNALSEMSVVLDQDLKALEKEIYQMAGVEFNLNSPKQLGEVLFEKLKIIDKPKKTKTGQYATGEDVLLKLAHKNEVVDKILEYRQLQKLKSTYVDALPAQIQPKTGKVHTTFAQTVAGTGRLASNNPNLQNIPIRTERGREIRKAFISSDDNHVLISADYSQIELRLIAEMSKDPTMIEAFNRGEDIHKTTASKIFNVSIEEVTREQRNQAKTVNFGIIYGVSAFGLSEQTGLSRKEAKELIDAYFETFPNLKKFMDEQIHLAREKGFIETILGRRRYIPDIHSANAVVRGQAERIAINAPVQGSAADVIKMAMIKIFDELNQKNLKTKMVLQVHDELVFEAPKNEVNEVKEIIKRNMENAIESSVPLTVEIGEGQNWLEAH